MSALARLDRYQRGHRWIGLPLATAYKFFDDRGSYLAATLSYYGFVAVFPLLLLFFSAAGFFLHGDASLRRQIESAAVKGLPVIGGELRRNIRTFRGSTPGIVVGVIGTLYGGSGMMQAAQAAFNTIYGVPRNEQPNPLKSRLRSFALLLLLGAGVIVSAGIAIAISAVGSVSRQLDPLLQVLGYAVSLGLALALFTGAFQLLTARDLHFRQVLRGGLAAAVAWEALQVGGSAFVSYELRHADALYGTFAIVLGTVAWIYLQSIVLLLAAELNVVIQLRLWPRALLSPFTDAVELTPGDRRAYTLYARAQRFKGFEEVEPGFSAPKRR